MSAEPVPPNPPINTPTSTPEVVANSAPPASSPPSAEESESISYDVIRKTTEEMAAFVQWVAELIRTRNWFTLLLLAEAVLVLFCSPEGVLAETLRGFISVPDWYPRVFGLAVVGIPIAAVGIAVGTMPRSLPETTDGKAVVEHQAIKGLRPFTQEDAEIFRRLQRQQDLKDCFYALESRSFRFGKLIGESGCGKTSFLQAGLVPLLQRRGKRAVYVRFSNQDPLEAVRDATIAQLKLTAPPPVASEPGGLIRLLEHVIEQSNTSLVLLFDQFEQFFVQAKEAERQPFLEALDIWYARSDLQDIKILFSLRADLSYHLLEIEKRLNYSPSPLDVSQLRCFQPQEAAQVLAVIAETEQLTFDRPFVERMMAEELGSRDNGLISPVDLQILASMLNRESVAELRGFNEQTFQKLGGIEGLLRRYLDNVIASRTTPRQQDILVKVLLTLTDIERQVRAEVLTIKQLQERLKDTATPREVYEATIWLARAEVRLISPVEPKGNQGDELAHERMISPVKPKGSQEYELAHERIIPALLQLSGKADKANQLLGKRVNEWLGSNYHSRYLFDIGELFLLRRQNAYLIWGAKEKEKQKLIRKSWQRLARCMAMVVLAGVLALGTWSGLEYTKAGQLWQMRRDIVWFSRGSDSKTRMAAGVLAANGHFRQALQLAEAIDHSSYKAYALSAIAQAYGELEQWRLALKTTRKCRGNEDCRVESLEAVLKVYAQKSVTDN